MSAGVPLVSGQCPPLSGPFGGAKWGNVFDEFVSISSEIQVFIGRSRSDGLPCIGSLGTRLGSAYGPDYPRPAARGSPHGPGPGPGPDPMLVNTRTRGSGSGLCRAFGGSAGPWTRRVRVPDTTTPAGRAFGETLTYHKREFPTRGHLRRVYPGIPA